MDSNVYNPSIPFVGPLPYPLQCGDLIKISGVVTSDATCFSINLQNGSNSHQRSDIALHLSPVFSSPPRIVRNSLENQSWGPEESHGPFFPLATNQSFEILILAETDHFKIAINGQHFTEFHYRLPLQNISHIAVDGDVTINSIKFEGMAKSPMASGSSEGIIKPLGFVVDSSGASNFGPPTSAGRPPSPYNSSSLPYPSNPTFGPSPTSPTGGMYPSQMANPYDSSSYNPYGPPPQGRTSPSPYGPQASGSSYPYGPPPQGGTSPYGPPPGSHSYPQQGYPQQSGAYPSQSYPSHPPQGYPANQHPSQPGPYPGTSVVYPGQDKEKEGGILGSLGTAGMAALAGAAGSALMGGKHKKKKNKYGHGHGMGAGLGGSLLGNVGSLVGGNKHGHSSSSGIPIGGAMAGGAAALAGAYMLSKSPIGKVMKPKKMFKHKHKSGWGGWSSSSSSSSD